MNQKTLAWVMLIPFTLLTVYVVYKVGYWGVIEYELQDPAGWQVLVDLVIACVLLLSWMIPEARRDGRNPWPYVGITLVLGSFGPLLYLITRKTKA